MAFMDYMLMILFLCDLLFSKECELYYCTGIQYVCTLLLPT